jgi:DNA polymerase III subunit delta'
VNITLHDRTQKQLEQFIAAPHHALLLVGPDGIGKTTLAHHITLQMLSLKPEQLASYPYLLHIRTEPGATVSIETVRSINKFLQLKTSGTAAIRRIVIVEHADGLTGEAQNAFLKLLEEPPADTMIILTVQGKRSLLPTIMSRVQIIAIQTPSEPTVRQHFAGRGSNDTDITKAYFLSGGLPGLMNSLLNDDTEHPLIAQVTTAKTLLQKSTFERLAMVDGLTKQRGDLDKLLDALLRIAATGIKQAGIKKDTRSIGQWHRIRKEVVEARDALAGSANSKLVLTKMLLHM